MILIEHPYRGHSIKTFFGPPDKEGVGHWWTAIVQHSDETVAVVTARTEDAALAEAKRRVDLLVEKPR